MYRVGTESGFIPEEDPSVLRLGLPGDGREGLSLPLLNGVRVALIGALQRLLWRQSQSGQQFPNRSQSIGLSPVAGWFVYACVCCALMIFGRLISIQSVIAST